MARFSEIVKGPRARRRGVAFTTLGGVEATCDLRLLTGADDEAILAAATAAAKRAGAEAVEGNIVFDFARACEVVARAGVDPDSSETDPRPYFDSAEQVKENLDRERIYLLFEAQAAYQDEASPRPSKMGVEELVQMMWASTLVPEGQELPFERLQPVLRRSCMRSLVELALTSDALRSRPTSPVDTSSTPSSGTSRPS